MDELAELGVAAHWRYKEGKGYSAKAEQKEIGEKLQWLREFISLSDDIKDGDAKEYYDSISRDIFEANVYVLTPQGKIVELPNGSTPVDFAYRIHTEVGHHTVGPADCLLVLISQTSPVFNFVSIGTMTLLTIASYFCYWRRW